MKTIPLIDSMAQDGAFADYLAALLMEICRYDTSIRTNVGEVRDAENAVFDVLERELRHYETPGLRLERRPIDPKIAAHPFFSQLYYTATPQNPKGLSVEQTYEGRGNLLMHISGNGHNQTGVKQALNGHIDVVGPFVPPRLENGVLHGRGACDDKGAVVALMGALKLVSAHLRAAGMRLNRDVCAMFVIEEEMGGNGSLSLAIDRDLRKLYDSLMVLECCSGRIHPGNRGALWYKIVIDRLDPSLSLLEASAFIVEELEREGRAIKAESRHDLFPHRPVQTCHGIMGPFGEHPSRINGRVDFAIRFEGGTPQAARSLLHDVLESAVAEYVGIYGDKTKVMGTDGKPKVARHYDLIDVPGGFAAQVYGSSGHMGSILENDGAITKMATMVRAILRSRAAIEATGGADIALQVSGHADAEHLTMEGGQGFLPTHSMDDLMRRLTRAARRGFETYARLAGCATCSADAAVRVTFDKLHNAAFAGRADSPDMRNAIDAAKAVGIWADEPVRGWDVSCDARIFACEYPDLPVLTSGPGALACAHSDSEQVKISDIVQFSRFLAYFLLQQTGTL